MPTSTDDVLKPAPLTPTVSVQQLIAEITTKVIDRLHQTDHNLEGDININIASITAKVEITVDTTIPLVAKLKDLWVDTSSDNQLKVCTSAYGSGNGVDNDWSNIHDNQAQQKAVDAETAAGTANTTTVSDTVPIAAKEGDQWIAPASNYQVKVCKNTYTDASEPTTPGKEAQWEITEDEQALLSVAVIVGLQDGKINQFWQDGVPDEADARDLWTDSSNSNSQQVCIFPYNLTSHPTVPEREDQWRPTRDLVSLVAANNAYSLADSKRITFFNTTVPPVADLNDLWVDRSESNKVKVCDQVYDDTSDPTDPEKETHWVETLDAAASLAAIAAQDRADSKAITYFLDDVPIGGPSEPVDIGDGWIDTDDDNTSRKAKASYLSTDFPGPGFGGFDSLTEAREAQWVESKDKSARDLAQSAQTLADGKRSIYFQTGVPNPDIVGTIDIGDGWYDTDDFQFYASRVTQVDGDGPDIQRWDRAKDKNAELIARQSLALIDLKRTTFNTAETDADALTKWPGPGGGDQIPITEWSSLNADDGTIGSMPNVTIVNGGTGYTTGTITAQGGGGSDFAATYTSTGGVIDSVNVTNAGQNYSTAPLLVVSEAGNGDAVIDGIINLVGIRGAQLGDYWFNIATAGERRYKICVEAYTGYDTDLGGTDHWESFNGDESFIESLDAKYSRDGSLALTAPVNFTPVQATQDFNGRDATLSGDLQADDGLFITTLRARHGGSDGAPGDPTGNSDVAHKKYVIDQVALAVAALIAAAPADLDTLNELAAALGDDANFSTTVINLISTAQGAADDAQTTADAAVIRTGDTMSGRLNLEFLGADIRLKTTNDSNKPAIRLVNAAGAELVTLHTSLNGSYIALGSADADIAADAGGKRIVGVLAGVGGTDAANVAQLTAKIISTFGDTFHLTGITALNTYNILLNIEGIGNTAYGANITSKAVVNSNNDPNDNWNMRASFVRNSGSSIWQASLLVTGVSGGTDMPAANSTDNATSISVASTSGRTWTAALVSLSADVVTVRWTLNTDLTSVNAAFIATGKSWTTT